SAFSRSLVKQYAETGSPSVSMASRWARHSHDRRGRPLPVWQGCRAIAQDEVSLMNWNEPASLDGRYFGPIPRDGTFAEARMSPLAVLRGISDVVAHLTVRSGAAGCPRARWQD